MLAAVPAAVFAAQPSCGDTLTVNTTLTADLDCSLSTGTALTLGANGITLNLNGHTITGPAGDDSYYGVYTTNNHDTITNGTIQDYGYGVVVSHAKNTAISWLTVIGEDPDSNDYGIDVESSTNTSIMHNTVSGQYEGTYLYGNAVSTLTANDSTADYAAFYFEYDTSDVMSHNMAHGSYGFLDYYSGGQTYTSNTANGGSQTGFYLYCDDYGHITVIGNTANGNAGDGFYTAYCYDYPPARFVPSVIRGNVANSNGENGFDDYYSVGARFRGNTAKSNGSDGFYMDYPSLQRIVGNIANHNSSSGIELDNNSGSSYGQPVTISTNTLKYNNYGVYADLGAPDGICHGNFIRHSTTAASVGINCS